MRFVLATNNPDKLREMREILTELGIDVVSMGDVGIDIDVEETGSTFLENAKLKAEAVCRASGLPSIADDSGLMVDALGGEPGVYSKRYGGGGLDGAGLCAFLLINMDGMEQRSAKFVSSIVCTFPDGRFLAAEGECSGEITTTPRGAGGFGYDPVFLVPGTDKTMAELPPDEKNKISHRAKALQELKRVIENYTITQGDCGAEAAMTTEG